MAKGLSVLSELAFYHSEHAGSLDAAHATYIIGEPRVSYLDSLSVRHMDEMPVDGAETDEGLGDVIGNRSLNRICDPGLGPFDGVWISPIYVQPTTQKSNHVLG